MSHVCASHACIQRGAQLRDGRVIDLHVSGTRAVISMRRGLLREGCA
jgi:hypothetical protein